MPMKLYDVMALHPHVLFTLCCGDSAKNPTDHLRQDPAHVVVFLLHSLKERAVYMQWPLS